MFDMVFDAFSAWNVMGLVIMGLVFMGVGGGLIAYELYWRIKSDKVDGRISGVRASGNMYHAVFEYKARGGDYREKISSMGANSLMNKIPGTPVSLMVFAGEPDKVRRRSVVLPVFGLIFFLPGVFVMNIAITTFEFNFMTLFMVLGGVGFIAYRISRVIRRIPKKEFKEGWKHFKENGVQVSETTSNTGKDSRVIDKDEIKKLLKAQYKYARSFGFIMLLIAAGLGGGAYYTGLDMINLMQNGVRAGGVVVGVNSRYYSNSDGSGYTYYAEVEFGDLDGRSVRFEDSIGSSHPMYSSGDQVDVIYHGGDPEEAMIDRGIFNWGLSGGLALGCLFILWGAMHNFRASRRYGASKYISRI